MSTLYEPDLTGSHPDYEVAGDLYTLYTADPLILEFTEAVYRPSLIITTVATVPEPLIYGVDWEVAEGGVAMTQIARMKNYDPSFAGELITKIRITRAISGTLKVRMRYQQLYPRVVSAVVEDGSPVQLTPDSWANALARIANLEALTQTVDEATALSAAQPKLLPLDIHKQDTGNQISNEPHTVNVFNGVNLIRPVQGSFFADGLVLRIPEINLTLVKGTHYNPVGFNPAKTKQTSNPGGIYDYIHLFHPYAGTVQVTYHAVGGEVTQSDVTTIYNLARSLKAHLEERDFLTPAALTTTPPVVSLINRVTALEDNMRALLSGSPNYGDSSSNGVAVVRRFRANDTQLHWWSIAKLYQVDGSSDVITADRALYRIRMVNAKLMADVAIAVDLAARDKLIVESSAVQQDTGFTLYGDVSVAHVTMPQFRIIHNTGTGADAGCWLQIGLELPTLLETIAIEDRSGIESCFILVPTNTSAILPQDDTITLPDGATYWDSAVADSKQAVRMMPNRTGYLVWAGDVPVGDLVAGGDASELTDHRLPTSFRVDDVRQLQLEFATDEGDHLRLDVPMTGTATVRQGFAVLPAVPSTGATTTSVLVETTLTRVDATTITAEVTLQSAPGVATTLALRYVVAHL